MARMVDISLLGAKELEEDLRSLPIAVQRALVRKGLRAAGKIHLAAAKARALSFARAVRIRIVKGVGRKVTRKDSMMKAISRLLKLRALKRSRKGFGYRVFTPTREELSAAIPTRFKKDSKWYPPAHIELGTKKTPALSYLRATFDENEEAMMKVIEDSVREGISEVWDRDRKLRGKRVQVIVDPQGRVWEAFQ